MIEAISPLATERLTISVLKGSDVKFVIIWSFFLFLVFYPMFFGLSDDTVIAESSHVVTAGECSIPLTGQWRFSLDPGNVGKEERWCDRELRGRIALPGSVTERGYGDDITVDTKWTGAILDRSWFTESKYEKYRQAGSVKVPFWLTPLRHYVGPVWYQKRVTIPDVWKDKRIELFLERCHWETMVWVDGKSAGGQDSLCTPHVYDLTDMMSPGEHLLTIRVDNSVKYNVGVNAHSISDHTQTNWNGIVGRMELRAANKIMIEDVQAYPDIETGTVKLKIAIRNDFDMSIDAVLDIKAACRYSGREHLPQEMTVQAQAAQGQTIIECDYVLGDDALLWDEFSPSVYKLRVVLRVKSGDSKITNALRWNNISAPQYELMMRLRSRSGDYELAHVFECTFGLRRFSTSGTQFMINDRPVFLRGTLECSIFPLTGYPAMGVQQWSRILKIAKSYGLNHLRFHSWCPPEAAFKAADRLGVYFHIETPCWTTIGDGKPIDKFVYNEGDRILKAYGNHPSFCMLAYGNEPGGGNQKRYLGDLVNYWKKKDPRRLYTSAAGWPIIPENQYHSTPAPRGHQWGAGLKSRFNAKAPETASDYREFVEKYEVPIVSHEIGQWCVFPNLDEIEKYTGVLRAGNFEIVRDSLSERGMLDQAHDFLMASGKLQALLYKQEIESALRTPGFGGFQLLDLHDFPGQGTALVGILDPFWDSKGYVGPDEHHQYCCETVPLVRMEKRIWTTNETFSAKAEIAHFGSKPIENAVVEWTLNNADGVAVSKGNLPAGTILIGNGTNLGDITATLDEVSAPSKLVLNVSLKGAKYSNSWDIWVYPSNILVQKPDDVLIVDNFSDDIVTALSRGVKVLLMPKPLAVNSDVPPGFTSIFWNTAWTRGQPPHTLGILCDPNHAALTKFPTEYYTNWQWWDLVTKSKAMVLNNFPNALRPIVQVVDDWNTNRKLALVFEAKVGMGRLLICSIDLNNDMIDRPVARQMLRSLLSYMESDRFLPQEEVEVDLIRELFREPPLLGKVKSVRADSEETGYEAANAIDGNPNTIWHTAWEPQTPDYPHELVIELEQETTISALQYLPRQDMSNGWISKYEVFASDDGKAWGKAVVAGELPRVRSKQKIEFSKPMRAKFIRFVALVGVDGQKFASIAELDVIKELNK